MLDLDFAFMNMLCQDKRGLVYRENLLNRLAPVFFSPRFQRLFQLEALRIQGGNIVLPLGPGNMAKMNVSYQKQVVDMAASYLDSYMLPALAADRRLRPYFFHDQPSFQVIFGDHFIQALAYLFIRHKISLFPTERIILVGEVSQYELFLEEVCMLGLPVIIQNAYPAQNELLAYRLLYEKGVVLNTTLFNPYLINAKDLAVFFDIALYQAALPVSRGYYIQLTDASINLAPQLEQELYTCQLDAHLHHLAPILEACLLAKAGYLTMDEEGEEADVQVKIDFMLLIKLGFELGLWELFLDKAV